MSRHRASRKKSASPARLCGGGEPRERSERVTFTASVRLFSPQRKPTKFTNTQTASDRLLKNPWNLTRQERQKLSDLQRNNRPIYRAYLLKESFQQIYDAPSASEADYLFSEWYSWARRSGLEPFRKFAATIKGHWPAVRRFLEVKLTNAIVEGTNSKIRMISHRAFGFHSAAALIAMIYLNCSSIVIAFTGW